MSSHSPTFLSHTFKCAVQVPGVVCATMHYDMYMLFTFISKQTNVTKFFLHLFFSSSIRKRNCHSGTAFVIAVVQRCHLINLHKVIYNSMVEIQSYEIEDKVRLCNRCCRRFKVYISPHEHSIFVYLS